MAAAVSLGLAAPAGGVREGQGRAGVVQGPGPSPHTGVSENCRVARDWPERLMRQVSKEVWPASLGPPACIVAFMKGPRKEQCLRQEGQRPLWSRVDVLPPTFSAGGLCPPLPPWPPPLWIQVQRLWPVLPLGHGGWSHWAHASPGSGARDSRLDLALAGVLGSLASSTAPGPWSAGFGGLASRHLDSGCLCSRPSRETVVLSLAEPRCPLWSPRKLSWWAHCLSAGPTSQPDTGMPQQVRDGVQESRTPLAPASPFPDTTCPSACTASKCKHVPLKEASPKSHSLRCSGGQVGPLQILRPSGAPALRCAHPAYDRGRASQGQREPGPTTDRPPSPFWRPRPGCLSLFPIRF